MISSLLVLEIYSHAKKNGIKFSDLIAEFEEYSQADEISIKLKDGEDIVKKIEKYYRNKKPKKIDNFDGLTIQFNDFWFSVRKSNTEPLLRINLEAIDKKTMKSKLKEILMVAEHN